MEYVLVGIMEQRHNQKRISTIQYMQNPKMNSISSAPKIGWLIEFFPKEIKSGF